MFKYRCRDCNEIVDLKHNCLNEATDNKSVAAQGSKAC